MSNFNPDTFMQASVEGVVSTQYSAIAEGEFPGYVKGVAARATEQASMMDVTWVVDDEEVKNETGLSEPTVRQTIFLDVDDNGMLDLGKGKNVQLGRLRAALGQNDGGAWSPSMLEGQAALITITQRVVTADREGNELPEADWRTYNDVKGVTARS
jgi:hypothetical protein